MTELRAFHGDPAIKEKYITRVVTHRRKHEIVQRTYNVGIGLYPGIVGCTVHSADTAAYETELGIPEPLAQLFDCIYEALPFGEYQKWAIQSLECIPVGADLSLMEDRILLWMLTEELPKLVEDRFIETQVRDLTALYQRRLMGDEPAPGEWQAACSFRVSAVLAARRIAVSADPAAEEAAYMRIRDKVVELLSAAPVDTTEKIFAG
jgi:hypothetical protein